MARKKKAVMGISRKKGTDVLPDREAVKRTCQWVCCVSMDGYKRRREEERDERPEEADGRSNGRGKQSK